MNCITGSYSQLSTKCQVCPHKTSCDNKRLEEVAYIIPNEPTTLHDSIKTNIGNQYTNADDITTALSKSLKLKMYCGFNR